MEKRIYNQPNVEVISFEGVDIVTASADESAYMFENWALYES